MAVFNPQTQYGNDPNYLNYPRVVDAPEVNLSKAITAKSISEGVEGSVKFMDTAIKQGIEENAYAQVDPERDKFTSALEAVKKGLDNGTIAAPVRTANGSTTGSLLDAYNSADDKDLPAGLESGLDRVTQLAQAYAAGSPKLNDTQYSASTLSIAKQLRAQYPGYRDEVDAAVSKASGLPVANSYYQNLMTDINRQLVQMGKSTKDEMPALMLKNMDVPGDPRIGIPNMGTLYTMRKNGDPKYPGDAYILQKISDWQNIQSQQKIDAASRAETSDNKKVQIDNEAKNVTSRSNDIVFHFINDNLALAGMDSLRNLTDYFSQVGATGKFNGVPQGDTEVQARQVQLSTYRNLIYQQIKRNTADSEGVMGADAVEKIRQTAMSPIDGYMTLAGGKDANPPLALYHMQQNKNIQSDSMNNVLINKDTGTATRQLLTARNIFGDQYFPQWIQNAPANVQEGMQGLFQQEKLFAVQDPTDQRGQPLPPRHLIDAVQHAKQIGNPDPNLYDSFLKVATGITDPNMPQPMKDRLIQWGFAPENRGLINEFRMDYRDQNGNNVPGKFAALNRLTSPAMTAAIAENAKSNPDSYKNYRDAAETEFGSAFRDGVKDLNQLHGTVAMGAGIKPLTVHYAYDNEKHNIVIIDNNNRPINQEQFLRQAGADRSAYGHAQAIFDNVNRINTGLSNMSKVYDADPAGGGNVDKYVLNLLQTTGFRPEGHAAIELGRSILKANKPEMTMDDLDKALGIQ